jgi:hypothetical protein
MTDHRKPGGHAGSRTLLQAVAVARIARMPMNALFATEATYFMIQIPGTGVLGSRTPSFYDNRYFSTTTAS